MSDSFTVLQRDAVTAARTGRLQTRHGTVETPMFMPVGTQASVKGMLPQMLAEIGAQIILSNTYHLHLRPGEALIRGLGGLHQFMSWDGPILTDSGGFQAFSLAALREVREDGIAFRSHLDGRPCFLGPREVMQIQRNLGSDIAMVIDECLPYPCERPAAEAGVARTLRWAAQCRHYAQEEGLIANGGQVFGIVQGAMYPDLRHDCAAGLVGLDCDGYAIGGVSVGEPESAMLEQVDACLPCLPEDKPRYVMGIGKPVQLLKMIARGVDLFDCVIPSREARHGTVYTPHGRTNLRNQRFSEDARPLVEGMDNRTCRDFSRAYLRHLVIAEEILGCVLLTLHNLHFFLDLMAQVRAHIAAGDYAVWHRQWIEGYLAGNGEVG